MMNELKTISIGFTLVDTNANSFSATSTFNCFDEPVLDHIGEKLNAFLRQSGYLRQNDYLLMEDLTEEERDALEGFLYDYRARENKEE